MRFNRLQKKLDEAKANKPLTRADTKSAEIGIQTETLSEDFTDYLDATLNQSKAPIKILTTPISEQAMLRRHLKMPWVQDRLEDLTKLALDASRPATRQDRYEAFDDVSCDGFLVRLTGISKCFLDKKKAQLKATLHERVRGLNIKNILLRQNKIGVSMWITLSDGCKLLNNSLVK